jgi:hypothetical protein
VKATTDNVLKVREVDFELGGRGEDSSVCGNSESYTSIV